MGVIIPQVVSEDRASGAQIVDGGLRFDGAKSQYLTRIPDSVGNRRTFTLSFWIKLNNLTGSGGAGHSNLYMGGNGTNDNEFFNPVILTGGTGISIGSYNFGIATTNAYFRDISGWYHIVIAVDTTQSAQIDKLKVYQNGVLLTFTGAVSSSFTTNFNTGVNNTSPQFIGELGTTAGLLRYYPYAQFSQYYLIDGQALGPGYFGYTDPLTNTWRPKKLTPTSKGGDWANANGDGINWSNITSATGGFNVSYPKENLYEGVLTSANRAEAASNDDPIVIDFSSIGGVDVISTISIWSGKSSVRYQINDSGSYTSYSDAVEAWKDISFSGKLNNLKILHGAAGNAAGASAIRIDGVILRDNLDRWGQNGFYLPFDGSAPIGQDQSGRGNNWTPVNFGGSNTIEKATGALPILNTDGGGKVARVGVRTDANASSLVLALPLVGIKSDFSNAINSGTSNKAITNNSVTFSSSVSNFYGVSAKFSGASLVTNSSADFNFGTGNFTVECWIYLLSQGSGSYNHYFSIDTQNTFALKSYSGNFYLYANSGLAVSSSNPPPLNKWAHLALVRNGSTLTIYVDGIASGSNSTSASFGTTAAATIGTAGGASGEYLDGYMSDLRVYKGVAKYTSNFIPASTDPDIVPDSPSGVSYSSNLTQITDGAVSFDGSSGTSLTISSAGSMIGTNDFTVEFFIYSMSTTDSRVFSLGQNNSSGSLVIIKDIDGIRVNWESVGNTGGDLNVVGSGWHHVAAVRSSNNLKLYIDGKLDKDYGTVSVNFDQSTLYIGDDSSVGSSELTGIISNLRVVQSALYTSDFTPPTAPLTATETTKLLCCQSNTQAGAAAVSPNISGINDGTVWSANVSASTGSIVDAGLGFDGSTSTAAYASSSASDTYIYVDFSTALSGAFKLWTGMASGSPTATVTHSGGTSVINLSSGENSLGTFTSVTRIAVNRGEAATHSFQAIAVDDVQLLDPVAVAGDASATNFNPFNTDINAVRGQESGYATLNPLSQNALNASTLSDGNLKCTTNSTARFQSAATLGMSSGKWYCEMYFESTTTDGNVQLGVADYNHINLSSVNGTISTSGGQAVYYRGFDGNKRIYTNGTESSSSLGSTYTFGNTIGIAFNADTSEVYFYKDGILQGSAINFPSTNYEIFFVIATGSSGVRVLNSNFGQKPFKFPPPAGFQPLTLANTPRPSIVRPDQYVGVTTYTGNNTDGRKITVGFKPDFVWFKSRSNSGAHALFDSIRGTAMLDSQATSAESAFGSPPIGGYLNTFESDGFTVKNGSTNNTYVNENAYTYVAWAWKAGGNSNTFNVDDVGYDTAEAAGITEGDLSLTGASIGTKQGFSICKFNSPAAYDGSTWGHGLTQSPDFVIMKHSGNTGNWQCYHSSIPSNYIWLNSANAAAGSNNWTITSTTATCGAGLWSHNNTATVAYHWHNVPGLQKFGSYTGNGSADGPAIITGFRPRWIMLKETGNANPWFMFDTERSKINPTAHTLWANYNYVENDTSINTDTTYNNMDILSNGFKLRSSYSGTNRSSGTYIYAAFAEAPTFNLYGAQANAR